jgi:hypothetical protein
LNGLTESQPHQRQGSAGGVEQNAGEFPAAALDCARADRSVNAALAGCEQALFSIPAELQVPVFPWHRVFEHAVGNKGGKTLKIISSEQSNKLQNLIPRPDVINGNPEDIVNITWDREVNIDLP